MGYKKKCRLCHEYFDVVHASRTMCDECKIKIEKGKLDRKKKRLAKKKTKVTVKSITKGDKKMPKENKKEEKKVELMVNNPKGFNRYNKNPKPVELTKNQIQKFMELSDFQQKELIAQLGNQLHMLRKEIRPVLVRFKKFKDYYEAKHFGWDWEDD